jgi:hypothetical protein
MGSWIRTFDGGVHAQVLTLTDIEANGSVVEKATDDIQIHYNSGVD